jgi:radical SAM-linked protein
VRLRVRYSKLGKVRFTSSRDVARIWERAMRRAGLPVALSEGFTPRPKISFGLALPTGAESIAEYVDIDLRPEVRAAEIAVDTLAGRLSLIDALSSALPVGFDVLDAIDRHRDTNEPGKGSLQDSVTACTWEFSGPQFTPVDHRRACELLAADTLVLERERKGKRSVDDLRPMILAVRSDGVRLIADLATIGRAVRPAELAELAYPGHDARDVRALRTHQWIDGPDGRREVLPVDPQLTSRLVGTPTDVAVPA